MKGQNKSGNCEIEFEMQKDAAAGGVWTHEPEGSGPKPDAFDHFATAALQCFSQVS